MPGECLRDVALGQRCWLRDRFDLGKLRRRSSTPAVVPGAAPALAKAGVGGYLYILYIYYHILLFNTLFTVNDEHVLTFFPAVTVDRLLNCWPTSLAVTESKGESINIY